MSADVTAAPAAVRFAGYAAVFGKRDSGGDVIVPGAFAATLAARKEAGVRLPLLWQHRTGQRIGWVELAEEDRHGLRVIASLSPGAGPAAQALAAGAVNGLSFGYRVRDAAPQGGGRELRSVDLIEVSLVTRPMQQLARVHYVDSNGGRLAPANPPTRFVTQERTFGSMDINTPEGAVIGAIETKADAFDASFDIVARQDETAAALEALRGDIAEVKGRLDKVNRAAVRPMIGSAIGGGEVADASPELKSFVDGYLRRGRDTELKALSIGSPADGGFAVPRTIDTEIARRLVKISPVRSVANIVQTSASGFRRLISIGGTASGWASETGARVETASPKLAEIVPPQGELYASPSATQQMLDDAAFDVEAWLAGEIATEFARAEGAAFINGTGTNQPRGFLAGPTTAQNDTARPFGTLQFIASGNANAFDAAPEAKLIDLMFSLRAGLRQGAVWMMNSATLAAVRKFKAADGSFLWQAGIVDGQPSRLLGYPVIEAEDMPDIGAGNFPIAFGNFNAGYLIAERSATTILRDPYTNKPYVQFYATRRVGGQVLDSDAIKLLKIST